MREKDDALKKALEDLGERDGLVME